MELQVNLLNRPGANYATATAPFRKDLFQDLEMEAIIQTMCKNDQYVYQACKNIILSPLTDLENVRYRQTALRSCIQNKRVIFSLYTKVAEIVSEINQYQTMHKKDGNPLPSVQVIEAIEKLDLLASGIERLKEEIANTYTTITSGVFRTFYDDFLKEFDTDFMEMVHQKCKMLKALQTGGEIQISAAIGAGMKSEQFLVNTIVEYQPKRKLDKIDALFHTVIKKDEVRISYDNLQLLRDCKDLETAGLLHIASYFDSFSKQIMKIFESLRYQLAFYYGCCNLHTHMTGMTFEVCFPEMPEERCGVQADGIYDLGFAIRTLKKPVDNQVRGKDTLLFLITGANHGGKTTYLRSIAIAQLMAQCGMFVPAKKMVTRIYQGIYTHFIRNEDVTMTSGKLEEELSRLSRIIDYMKKDSIIFLNESFATTSEREGAIMAEDIVRAFYDNQITCFFVTHIYAFAKKAYEQKLKHTQFLQAERTKEGQRTYLMQQGEPGITGYGMELYKEIVGVE